MAQWPSGGRERKISKLKDRSEPGGRKETDPVEALRSLERGRDDLGERVVPVLERDVLRIGGAEVSSAEESAGHEGKRAHLIDVKVLAALEGVVGRVDDERTGQAVGVVRCAMSVPPLQERWRDQQSESLREKRGK